MKTIEAPNKYHAQAEMFLLAHNIVIKFVWKDTACPPWKEGECKHIHGDHYRVYFRRGNNTFNVSFWNSYDDAINGIKPHAYDILIAIVKNDPGSFADFCRDFGYNDDSRQAHKTWKSCVKQWEQVKRFFTEAEIEELQEVQ